MQMAEPLGMLYWLSQWVEKYTQVGMHIVKVPMAGQPTNTSTDYAAEWWVAALGFLLVVYVRWSLVLVCMCASVQYYVYVVYACVRACVCVRMNCRKCSGTCNCGGLSMATTLGEHNVSTYTGILIKALSHTLIACTHAPNMHSYQHVHTVCWRVCDCV